MNAKVRALKRILSHIFRVRSLSARKNSHNDWKAVRIPFRNRDLLQWVRQVFTILGRFLRQVHLIKESFNITFRPLLPSSKCYSCCAIVAVLPPERQLHIFPLSDIIVCKKQSGPFLSIVSNTILVHGRNLHHCCYITFVKVRLTPTRT